MGDPRGTAMPEGLHIPPDDPAFQAWARARGRPVNRGTPAGELGELLAQYEFEGRERQRRADEAARRRGTDRPPDRQTDWRALQPRRTADDEDRRLAARIQSGWGRGDSSLATAAEQDVSRAVPVKRFLYASHGSDKDEDRWTYLRHYLLAYHTIFGAGPPSEQQLLQDVVKEEKLYLAEMKRRADELARTQRPALQREALRAWARRQHMNPADNFHPGVAYYDQPAAMSHPDWMDKDVASISQRDYTTTITYTRGKPLSFSAKALDFEGTYQSAAVDLFFRRHKASGRLVPFLLYRRDVDLYAQLPEIDALSSDDRVLMALPYPLTPAVAGYYSQDPLLQVASGLLGVLQLLSLQKGLPIAAPVTAGVLRVGARVTTGGLALGRAALTEVTIAVRTFGFSAQAASYVGRSAYTYYLANAVVINQTVVVGAEIAFTFTGQDAGPGPSPGDVLSMAVADDAARAGSRAWKAMEAEVIVDEATGAARLRVNRIYPISAEAAEAEFEAGLKVTGQSKGASRAARAVDAPATVRPGSVPPLPKGKGKVVIPPDPRPVIPTGEIEDAMKKVVQGLGKLKGKYSATALDKLRGISADAIRESGIRPSDLAKLVNSLARAGPTTQQFIERFHSAPGFEQVILNWRKRHFWNARLATPAWSGETKAFYTGTSFLMKYAVRKLDPRTVRFEWPVSINTARWGGEVPARFVDVVVSGGNLAKPGDLLQIELKSWTAWVLRSKTSFSPGQATSRPGSVGYQLIRDTALFQPQNIRWVFDGAKLRQGDLAIAKKLVIDRFEEIIHADDYLRAQWGGDRTKIRELLDKVVEVF